MYIFWEYNIIYANYFAICELNISLLIATSGFNLDRGTFIVSYGAFSSKFDRKILIDQIHSDRYRTHFCLTVLLKVCGKWSICTGYATWNAQKYVQKCCLWVEWNKLFIHSPHHWWKRRNMKFVVFLFAIFFAVSSGKFTVK